MGVPKYVPLLLAFAGHMTHLPPASAQNQSSWRFWTTEDGLTESYTRKISVGGDGRVFMRHGAVPNASVLDGYNVAQIPEPRTASDIDWSRLARLHTGRKGELWTVEEGVLKRFADKKWRTEAV